MPQGVVWSALSALPLSTESSALIPSCLERLRLRLRLRLRS
ncbi:hypothetical protein [Streptomyces sp. BV286]|nr:hypothetical protein [Streptomyces sp. BV286]